MKQRDELTRLQASHRLKCSQAQCIRFEVKGLLHVRREDPAPGYTRQHVYYKAAEVAALAAWWKPSRGRASVAEASIIRTNERGKIAAKAFIMFREGKSLEEMVIALEVDPLMIRQLREEWQRSFEDDAARERKRRRDIAEAAEQKRELRHLSVEEYRAHQKELAKIEADGVVRAAREAAAAQIQAAADEWRAAAEKRRTGT